MRRLMLCALMLFAITATSGARAEPLRTDSTGVFATSPTSTGAVVVLTEAQADSLVRLLDEMELTIRLLEADLAEVRPEPEPTGGWIVRAMKHPALWFCIGVVTGGLIAR